MKLYIFLIIVIVILFILSTKIPIIEYWDYNPGKKTKSICFIAGVHGNEPAGSEALKDLINSGYFKNSNYKIRVIPSVNKWGLKYNTRYKLDLVHPDINRNFLGTGLEPISSEVIRLVNNYDLIVDFHEGYSYHLINPQSVGSTLSPSYSMENISILIVNKLNESISNPVKKFVMLKNRSCEIPKTLSCLRKNQKRDYILVETSGQNNIQPLEVRKNQVKTIVDTIINGQIY